MRLFQELHIKLLGVALLVVLTSYDGFEKHRLPEHVKLECVAHGENDAQLIFYWPLTQKFSEEPIAYAHFSFDTFLRQINFMEINVFNMEVLNSYLLKEFRAEKAFLIAYSLPSKAFHTSVI